MHINSCPLDASELVFLGCWLARPSKPDVSYSYCPRCDAAFVLWAGRDLFTWRRKAGQLQLEEADKPRVADYLRFDWQAVEANMLRETQLFLEHRFQNEQCCPNDGGKIPFISATPTVRFYWCKYCSGLFAFMMDIHYGWQCVATLVRKRDNSGYILCSGERNEAKLEAILSCAPAPSFLRA